MTHRLALKTTRGSSAAVRVALACAGLVLLGASMRPEPARADERWLFVPVLSGQRPRDVAIAQLSGPFEIELRAQGESVISNVDAALLFETRQSSEPVKLNDDELSRLLRSVGLAARHLALGELPQAQQSMEGVYALSGPARDYLNREAARARKIFDTCLMTAYLWERDEKRQQALRQMLECSRNFPGFRPEGHAYPPELRNLFELAKQQLNQQAATALVIRSTKGSACGVRLNGIEVGKSPMRFSDVRAGVTRVQLECQSGVAGRIHAVELKPGENTLEIDPEFDAAVHSQAALWLQYSNDSERSARMDADLAKIQAALGSPRVVGLVIEGHNHPRVRVRSITEPPQDVAAIAYSVGQGYNPEAVTDAIKRVRPRKARRPAVVTAERDDDSPIALEPPPPPLDPAPETAPAPETPPPSQQNVLAGSLLAIAGVGGLATGWVFYGLRYQYRLDTLSLRGVLDVSAASYNPEASWTLVATGAGSLLLAISDYFWLPDAEGVPALAWVAGGVGVAVTLAGIGFAVLGSHCESYEDGSFSPACNGFANDVVFGPMLAMHGLPLLGIPLSYALRAALRPAPTQVALNLETVRGGGALLQLRGAF